MEETIKIVLMVVVLMPMMMGNEDLEIIVNQMRMEIKTMRNDLIATEKDLLTTKKELLTSKIDVNQRLEANDDVIQELKGEIYSLKNAPRSFVLDNILLQVSYILVLIGASPDLTFLAEAGQQLGRIPGAVIGRNNPIDIDVYSHQSSNIPGLFAMGPLTGDNFVR